MPFLYRPGAISPWLPQSRLSPEQPPARPPRTCPFCPAPAQLLLCLLRPLLSPRVTLLPRPGAALTLPPALPLHRPGATPAPPRRSFRYVSRRACIFCTAPARFRPGCRKAASARSSLRHGPPPDVPFLLAPAQLLLCLPHCPCTARARLPLHHGAAFNTFPPGHALSVPPRRDFALAAAMLSQPGGSPCSPHPTSGTITALPGPPPAQPPSAAPPFKPRSNLFQPRHGRPLQPRRQLLHSPLAKRARSSYISGERLARASASPTWSDPEGSSHNEPRLGRCPASHLSPAPIWRACDTQRVPDFRSTPKNLRRP
jgi:hypothetical protein